MLYRGRAKTPWGDRNRYNNDGDSRNTVKTALSTDKLEEILGNLDGQQYGRLKALQGTCFLHKDPEMSLLIDKIQSDPFAPPSNIRIKIPNSFSPSLFSNKIRKVALEDYLGRSLNLNLSSSRFGQHGGDSKTNWHSLKGDEFQLDPIGQQVLQRTCILANDEYIEARLRYSFPARGRSIMGYQAVNSLLHELPLLMKASLLSESLDEEKIRKHVDSIEDQEALRQLVKSSPEIICFIRNGACLPRAAGNSDLPLPGAIAFQSPANLERSFCLPNCGLVTGMGIPRGITLIAGGGFHGKSTLLDAIQFGIYNHVPGDGREFIATDDRVCKIRAEDGRNVSSVDISPFINNIPFGRDTRRFCTEDASGSTSMAASIQEALEVGCRGFLLDEDTCATNFLIRDERMEMLVNREKEPITPLIMKIKALYKERDCSSILVIGGCGSYLDVADTVLTMESYRTFNVTEKAKSIALALPLGITLLGDSPYGPQTLREIKAFPGEAQNNSLHRNSPPLKSKTKQLNLITFSGVDIDLSSLEQIASLSQSRMILESLLYIKSKDKYFTRRTIGQIVDDLERLWDERGLDVIAKDVDFCPPGNFARPRKFELAAALNRLRGISIEIRK